MEIGTRVFGRIMQENRAAAVETIADTMEETARFGFKTRPATIDCASRRLDAQKAGKPWDVRRV